MFFFAGFTCSYFCFYYSREGFDPIPTRTLTLTRTLTRTLTPTLLQAKAKVKARPERAAASPHGSDTLEKKCGPPQNGNNVFYAYYGGVLWVRMAVEARASVQNLARSFRSPSQTLQNNIFDVSDTLGARSQPFERPLTEQPRHPPPYDYEIVSSS